MKPNISLPDHLMKRLGVTTVYHTFIGGQKYVFIAECQGIKRAIKLFRSGFNERDKRELDFYTNNSHLDGIPQIVDIIKSGKDTVLIEEFIEGDCLDSISHKYKSDHQRITTLVKELITIMSPIWKEKKVHRDLKPLNIIIKPDKKPVILDFGIIKDPDDSTITETGFQPNSWQFAAPEQYIGNKHSISYRTDFFSIGVIAYFLCFQKLPFGETRNAIETQIKNGILRWETEDSCPLNKLFHTIFKINVSERPRNIERLLQLLKQY